MNPFDVYAVRRPVVKRDWVFERITYLPDGGVSSEMIRLDNMTSDQALEAKATYAAPDVTLCPLYSTKELGID